MPYGQRLGMGWGFGFRGYSPPWPYIGRGRGGLPRCWAYLPYSPSSYPGWGYPYPVNLPPNSAIAREQEIAFLKDQAEILRQQLEQIDARISELEKGKEGN